MFDTKLKSTYKLLLIIKIILYINKFLIHKIIHSLVNIVILYGRLIVINNKKSSSQITISSIPLLLLKKEKNPKIYQIRKGTNCLNDYFLF